jgi:hypothetical protein
VLGTVNAIASAIVVYFMAISFTCEIGDDRTLATKFFFRRARGCSLEAHLAGFADESFRTGLELLIGKVVEIGT